MDREFNFKEIKVGIDETLKKSHPMYFAKAENGKIDHYGTYTDISKVMIEESYSPIDRLKVYSAYRSIYADSLGNFKLYGVDADMVNILDTEIKKMKELIEMEELAPPKMSQSSLYKKSDNKDINEGEEKNYPRYFALKLILDELKIVDREGSEDYKRIARANVTRLHEFITGIPTNSLNTFIYHDKEDDNRIPKRHQLKVYLTKIRELFVPFSKNPNDHIDKILKKIDQAINDIGSY